MIFKKIYTFLNSYFNGNKLSKALWTLIFIFTLAFSGVLFFTVKSIARSASEEAIAELASQGITYGETEWEAEERERLEAENARIAQAASSLTLRNMNTAPNVRYFSSGLLGNEVNEFHILYQKQGLPPNKIYTSYLPPKDTFNKNIGTEHSLDPCLYLGQSGLKMIGRDCMIKIPFDCGGSPPLGITAKPGENCLSYSFVFNTISGDKKLDPKNCSVVGAVDKTNCLSTQRPYCHLTQNPILGINCRLAPCNLIPNHQYRRPGVNCLADCNDAPGIHISEAKFFMEGFNCLSSCRTSSLKSIGANCVLEFNDYVMPLCTAIDANTKHFNLTTDQTRREGCLDVIDLPLCVDGDQGPQNQELQNCVNECNAVTSGSHNKNCVNFDPASSLRYNGVVNKKCHSYFDITSLGANSNCTKIECDKLSITELARSLNIVDVTEDRKYCTLAKYTNFSIAQFFAINSREPSKAYLREYALADKPCYSRGDTEEIETILSSAFFGSFANTKIAYLKAHAKSKYSTEGITVSDEQVTKGHANFVSNYIYAPKSVCLIDSATQMISCENYKRNEIPTAPYDCNAKSFCANCPQTIPGICSEESDQYCYKNGINCNSSINQIYPVCSRNIVAESRSASDEYVSWFFRPNVPGDAIKTNNTTTSLAAMKGYPTESVTSNLPNETIYMDIENMRANGYGADFLGFGVSRRITPPSQGDDWGIPGVGAGYICGMGGNYRGVPNDDSAYFRGEVQTNYEMDGKVSHAVDVCIRYASGSNALQSCGYRDCHSSCAFGICTKICGIDVCRTLKIVEGPNVPIQNCGSNNYNFKNGNGAECVKTYETSLDAISKETRVRIYKPDASNYICAVLEFHGITTDLQTNPFFNGTEYFSVPDQNNKGEARKICVSGTYVKSSDSCVNGINSNGEPANSNTWRTSKIIKYIMEPSVENYIDQYGIGPADLSSKHTDPETKKVVNQTIGRVNFNVKRYFETSDCIKHKQRIGAPVYHSVATIINSERLFLPSIIIEKKCKIASSGTECENVDETDFFKPAILILYGGKDVSSSILSESTDTLNTNYKILKIDATENVSADYIIKAANFGISGIDVSQRVFIKKEFSESQPKLCLYKKTPMGTNPETYKEDIIQCVNRKRATRGLIQPAVVVPAHTNLSFQTGFLKNKGGSHDSITEELPKQEFQFINMTTNIRNKEDLKKCIDITSQGFPICIQREECSLLNNECVENEKALIIEKNSASPQIGIIQQKELTSNYCKKELLAKCNSKKGYALTASNQTLNTSTTQGVGFNAENNPAYHGWFNEFCIVSGIEKLDDPSSKVYVLTQINTDGQLGACVKDDDCATCNDLRCLKASCCKILDTTLLSFATARLATPHELGLCYNLDSYLRTCSAISYGKNSDISDPFYIGETHLTNPHQSHIDRFNSSFNSSPYRSFNAEYEVAYAGTNSVKGKCVGFYKNAISDTDPTANCNANGEWEDFTQSSCTMYTCPTKKLPLGNGGADLNGSYPSDYDASGVQLSSKRGVIDGYANWESLKKTTIQKQQATAISCIVGFTKKNALLNFNQITPAEVSPSVLLTSLNSYKLTLTPEKQKAIFSLFSKIIGYSGGSSPTRNCNQLGNWESVTDSCERITCPPIEFDNSADAGAFNLNDYDLTVADSSGQKIIYSINSPFGSTSGDLPTKAKFLTSVDINAPAYLSVTNSMDAYKFLIKKRDGDNLVNANLEKNTVYVVELASPNSGKYWEIIPNQNDDVLKILWQKSGGASFDKGYALRSNLFDYEPTDDPNDKHRVIGTCNEKMGFKSLSQESRPQLTCDSSGNWVNLSNPCVTDCGAISDPVARNTIHGFSRWLKSTAVVGQSKIERSSGCSADGYQPYPYTPLFDEEGTKKDFGIGASATEYTTSDNFDAIAVSNDGANFIAQAGTGENLTPSLNNIDGIYYNLKIQTSVSDVQTSVFSATQAGVQTVFYLFDSAQRLSMSPPSNAVWSKINFSSFGTPDYSIKGNVVENASCRSPYSKLIFANKCIGKTNCSVGLSDFTNYDSTNTCNQTNPGNGVNGEQNDTVISYGSGGGGGGGNNAGAGGAPTSSININGISGSSYYDKAFHVTPPILSNALNNGVKVDLKVADTGQFIGKNGSVKIIESTTSSFSAPRESNYTSPGENTHTVTTGSSGQNIYIKYEMSGAGGGGGGPGLNQGTDGASGTKMTNGVFVVKNGTILKIYVGGGGGAGKTKCITPSGGGAFLDPKLFQPNNNIFAYKKPESNFLVKALRGIGSMFISEGWAWYTQDEAKTECQRVMKSTCHNIDSNASRKCNLAAGENYPEGPSAGYGTPFSVPCDKGYSANIDNDAAPGFIKGSCYQVCNWPISNCWNYFVFDSNYPKTKPLNNNSENSSLENCKTRISCSGLSSAHNVSVDQVEYTESEKTLNCREGYTGSITYKCTGTKANGTFTKVNGSCTAKNCTLSGSAFSNAGSVSGSGAISCNSGYTASTSPSPTYTCDTNGGTATVSGGCYANDCNANALKWTGFSTVSGGSGAGPLECSPGYTASTSPAPGYYCGPDGNHSYAIQVGSCNINNCKLPAGNGYVANTAVIGAGNMACSGVGYNSADNFSYQCNSSGSSAVANITDYCSCDTVNGYSKANTSDPSSACLKACLIPAGNGYAGLTILATGSRVGSLACSGVGYNASDTFSYECNSAGSVLITNSCDCDTAKNYTKLSDGSCAKIECTINSGTAGFVSGTKIPYNTSTSTKNCNDPLYNNSLTADFPACTSIANVTPIANGNGCQKISCSTTGKNVNVTDNTIYRKINSAGVDEEQTLTCDTGYSNGASTTISAKCLANMVNGVPTTGALSNIVGTCSAITCTAPLANGYSAKTGLPYTALIGAGTIACDTAGYSGNAKYTCQTKDADVTITKTCDCDTGNGYSKNINGVCVKECTIPAGNGYESTTISATQTRTGTTRTGTISCGGTGYSTASFVNYSCNDAGTPTINGSCACASGYFNTPSDSACKAIKCKTSATGFMTNTEISYSTSEATNYYCNDPLYNNTVTTAFPACTVQGDDLSATATNNNCPANKISCSTTGKNVNVVGDIIYRKINSAGADEAQSLLCATGYSNSGSANISATCIPEMVDRDGGGVLVPKTGSLGVTGTCNPITCSAPEIMTTSSSNNKGYNPLSYTALPYSAGENNSRIACSGPNYKGYAGYTCTAYNSFATITSKCACGDGYSENATGDCVAIVCDADAAKGYLAKTGLNYSTGSGTIACDQTGYGGTVTYTCTANGKVGSVEVCGCATGYAKNVSGDCVRITCNIPTGNGFNAGKIEYTTTQLNYSCNAIGYRTDTTALFSCSDNRGSTTGTLGIGTNSCQRLTCRIDAGNGYSAKSGLYYSTTNGYIASNGIYSSTGTGTIACDQTGYSAGTIRYICNDPKATQETVATIVSGDSCACALNYYKNEDGACEPITCTSDTDPVVIEKTGAIKTKDLPITTNGTIACETTAHTGTATYTCSEDTTRTPRVAKGIFTIVTPCACKTGYEEKEAVCTKINCGILASTSPGFVDTIAPYSAIKVNYFCNHRLYDNTVSVEFPACETSAGINYTPNITTTPATNVCKKISCTIPPEYNVTQTSIFANDSSQNLICATGYSNKTSSPISTTISVNCSTVTGERTNSDATKSIVPQSGSLTINNEGSCTRLACTVPAGSNTTKDGTLVDFTDTATPLTCANGYAGSPTYTCTGTTTAIYTSFGTPCAKITCTVPTGITGFDSDTTGIEFGTSDYYCNTEGFQTSTKANFSCTANSTNPTTSTVGTFSQNSNSCARITCSAGANKGYSDKTNLPYAKTGSGTIACATPNYQGNANYTCTTHGVTATITLPCQCGTGYERNANDDCVAITCTVPAGTGYTARYNLDYTGAGVRRDFDCDTEGYYGKVSYECPRGGVSAKYTAECTRVKCNLPLSANSNIVPTMVSGSEYREVDYSATPRAYSCGSGFRKTLDPNYAQLTPTYTCVKNTNLALQSNPSTVAVQNACVEITCTDPYTNITYSFNGGQPQIFSCETSRGLWGESELNCNEAGIVNKIRSCYTVKCLIPADKNTSRDGTLVDFSVDFFGLDCKQGFYYENATRPKYKCIYTANEAVENRGALTFEGTCQRITCTIPTEGINSLNSVLDSTSVNWNGADYITTSCREGFYQSNLALPPKYSCSGANPIGELRVMNPCAPVTCDLPERFGMLAKTNLEYGQGKTTSCNKSGYFGTVTYNCVTPITLGKGVTSVASSTCVEASCVASGNVVATFNTFVSSGSGGAGGIGGKISDPIAFLRGGNGGNSTTLRTSGSGGGGGSASMISIENRIIAIAGGGGGGAGGGGVENASNALTKISNIEDLNTRLIANVFGPYFIGEMQYSPINITPQKTTGILYNQASHPNAFSLTIPSGTFINDIFFASYGSPIIDFTTPESLILKYGTCNDSSSLTQSINQCSGKSSCVINTNSFPRCQSEASKKFGLVASYYYQEPTLQVINSAGLPAYSLKERYNNQTIPATNMSNGQVYTFLLNKEDNIWFKYPYLADEYLISEAVSGAKIKIKFHRTNTTFSPRLKINGISSTISKLDESGQPISLSVGYINPTKTYVLTKYSDKWIIREYISQEVAGALPSGERVPPSRSCMTNKISSTGAVNVMWSLPNSSCINRCPGYDMKNNIGDDRIGVGATKHSTSAGGEGIVYWSDTLPNNWSYKKFKSNASRLDANDRKVFQETEDTLTPLYFRENRSGPYFALARFCNGDGSWNAPIPLCVYNNANSSDSNMTPLTNGTSYISGESQSYLKANNAGEEAISQCLSGYDKQTDSNYLTNGSSTYDPPKYKCLMNGNNVDQTYFAEVSDSSRRACVKYCAVNDIAGSTVSTAGKGDIKVRANGTIELECAANYFPPILADGTTRSNLKPYATCISDYTGTVLWATSSNSETTIGNKCTFARPCDESSLTKDVGSYTRQATWVATCWKSSADYSSKSNLDFKQFQVDNNSSPCPDSTYSYKSGAHYNYESKSDWFPAIKFIESNHRSGFGSGLTHTFVTTDSQHQKYGKCGYCKYGVGVSWLPHNAQWNYVRRYLQSYSCYDAAWSFNWSNVDTSERNACDDDNWDHRGFYGENGENHPSKSYLGECKGDSQIDTFNNFNNLQDY